MIENKTKFNLEYVTHNYRSGWPADDVKKSFVAQGEYDYVLPPGAVGTQLWRFHQGGALYRVAHLLANLGWVDFDFGCSTLCLVLLGLMGNWQKWLSSWARCWNIIDQSHPNQTIPADGPPCIVKLATELNSVPGPRASPRW